MHIRIMSVPTAITTAALLLAAQSAIADVLWNNGGLITNPGAGFNGADVSQLAADVPNGSQAAHNNSIFFRKAADDFVVPAGGWTISNITSYAFITATYSTFPPTTPITSMRVDLYNNLPTNGSQVIIASGTTILDNSWTGIYSTPNGAANLMANNRPIMGITVDFGNLVLPAGNYGISFSINGHVGSTVAVGIPYAMTTDGSGNPLALTGNAEGGLSTSGGASGTYSWTALELTHGGVSLPFLINGSVPAPGTAVLFGFGSLAAARRRRVA